MVEKRQSARDTKITPAISCIVKMPGGTTLDGVVEDLSDNGAGIAGATAGLSPGDKVELVLIVLADQRVVYQAEVRHVEPDDGFFGVRFTSGPQAVEADNADSSRVCCGHRQDTLFCAHCGKRLNNMVAANTARR